MITESDFVEAEKIGAISFEMSGRVQAEITRLREDITFQRAERLKQQQTIKRLSALVAIARLAFASDLGDEKLDGLDQIEFAEKNGLYEDYIAGAAWPDVFAEKLHSLKISGSET